MPKLFLATKLAVSGTTGSSTTLTINVAVLPSYVTVICFSPAVVLSNPLTVNLECSTILVVPSVYVAVTTMPVRSSSSPTKYSVLVGGVVTLIALTATLELPLLPPDEVVSSFGTVSVLPGSTGLSPAVTPVVP